MICAMTARRVSAGKADEFLEAFRSGTDSMPDEIRDQFKAVYACKDVTDPDVVLTFGLFKGTIDELRELQSRGERGEQLEGIAPLVEEVLIDGSFEVVGNLVEQGAAAG
jgi:hypothetical protein